VPLLFLAGVVTSMIMGKEGADAVPSILTPGDFDQSTKRPGPGPL